jgi:GNAT superfamily N-acetyltransferase
MMITIRSATPQDAEQLCTMIRDLARYEKEEESVKLTAADLRQQLNLAIPPFECAIADLDGKPVGFALYFYAYSTWEGTRTLYLEDLFVHPDARGAGVGKALMRYLARTADEQDCRRFEWSVLDWNESAIEFYHGLGAKPLLGWTRFRADADTIQTLARAS